MKREYQDCQGESDGVMNGGDTMTFHVVALPHTRTAKEFSACAYTQKVLNFCKMMSSLGHTVYHYGAEGSEVACVEHITVISSEEQRQLFGDCDWRRSTFRLKWDPAEPAWQLTNTRAAAAVNQRKRRGDFLCVIGGGCHRPVAEVVGDAETITVEFGVGYYGVFAKFRVFETYTHQSAVYAMLSPDPNAQLYDAVIPNYYDPADFPPGRQDGGYLLFLARLTHRKGLEIAVQTARAAKLPLKIAGQGVLELAPDHLITEEGQYVALDDQVQYVGYADVARRAELMGAARALIQPTIFLEPFGGNVVEAQLCGTPVITTDHAAFSETVRHGVTGYRCHTLEQFVWAANAVERLDTQAIRQRAFSNYSIHRVRWMYSEYFQMLAGLWGEGWPMPRERSEMQWLTKY